LNAARLSAFVNRWRLVHDFTPSREPNYKLDDGVPELISAASEKLRSAIYDSIRPEELDQLHFDVTGSTHPLLRKDSRAAEKHFFLFPGTACAPVLRFLSTCTVIDTIEAAATDPYIARVVDRIDGDRPAANTAVICALVSGEFCADLQPPALLHLTATQIDSQVTSMFEDAASDSIVFGSTF
jgi:hypothetical protein